MQNSIELIYTINVEGNRLGGTLFHPDGNSIVSINGDVLLITDLGNKQRQRFAAAKKGLFAVMTTTSRRWPSRTTANC
jgi:hypothetical protein